VSSSKQQASAQGCARATDLCERSIIQIVRGIIGDEVDLRLDHARGLVLARPRVCADLANRGPLCMRESA
jgi:hypothetical protein